jgi:hypothetical protein
MVDCYNIYVYLLKRSLIRENITMDNILKSPTEKLYDQDYQLWLETTLEQLASRSIFSSRLGKFIRGNRGNDEK